MIVYYDYDGFDSYGAKFIEKTEFVVKGEFVDVYENGEKRCLIGPLPKDYKLKWLYEDWRKNTKWFQSINKIYY